MLTNAQITIADDTATANPFSAPEDVGPERRFRLEQRVAMGTDNSISRMWFSLEGTAADTVTFELWAQLESQSVTIAQAESELAADRQYFRVTDVALAVVVDGTMESLLAADVLKLPSGGKFAIRVTVGTVTTPAVLRIMVA